MPNYIVGLDVGSRTIKAAVGQIKNAREITLLDVFKFDSIGLRRGVVSDISSLTQSLAPVLAAIKKISKGALNNIYLGVGSNDLRVQSSTGVVAVSRADYEIYQDDINRAVQSAQAVNLASNRLILHSIIKDFTVDGVKDVRDPLGLVGSRLEVESLIIDAFAPAVKNLTKCAEILGGSVGGLVLTPLADARAVLSPSQKELGVALIDIGFGKTSLCVYEENKLLHAAIFPVGSGNITNDLAIGLKIPVEAAETVKLSFGSALSKEVSARDAVELAKINPNCRGAVSKKFIADIIEVRLAEILELVNNDLRAIGKAGRLPGGIVLVGGGVKIPGIIDLVRQELKLSTQIGLPDLSGIQVENPDISERLEDPEFTTALGLMLCGSDKALETRALSLPFTGALKRVWRYFLP